MASHGPGYTPEPCHNLHPVGRDLMLAICNASSQFRIKHQNLNDESAVILFLA